MQYEYKERQEFEKTVDKCREIYRIGLDWLVYDYNGYFYRFLDRLDALDDREKSVYYWLFLTEQFTEDRLNIVHWCPNIKEWYKPVYAR